MCRASIFFGLRKSKWFGTNALHQEEGSVKPVRTGHEVALYNDLKKFITTRKPDEKLDFQKLLAMGLNASAESDGSANLQTALLTIHNVIRFLARSDKWGAENPDGSRSDDVYGHPKTDPMYPIFRELKGFESTDGTSLPDFFKQRRSEKLKGEVANPLWSLDLFDPKNGIFAPLPGSKFPDPNTEKVVNAGSHYYFWIGTLADTATVGRLRTVRGAYKLELAQGLKEEHIARRQLEVMQCGGFFGEDAVPRVSVLDRFAH